MNAMLRRSIAPISRPLVRKFSGMGNIESVSSVHKNYLLIGACTGVCVAVSIFSLGLADTSYTNVHLIADAKFEAMSADSNGVGLMSADEE
jgi:hypothetical protein